MVRTGANAEHPSFGWDPEMPGARENLHGANASVRTKN